MRKVVTSFYVTIVLGVLAFTVVEPAAPIAQIKEAPHALASLEMAVVELPSTPQVETVAITPIEALVLAAPKPEPKPVQKAAASSVAPVAGQVTAVSPGTSQAIAHEQVLARNWDETQFTCLVNLWQKESNWRSDAMNKSSGAYGIPQSLPGSKMASAGADWQTNPATQIKWGLDYISGRYSNPCGAWSASQTKGWY